MHVAHDLKRNRLRPGDPNLRAGRLGVLDIRGDNVLLGQPFIFNRDNIDRFDF